MLFKILWLILVINLILLFSYTKNILGQFMSVELFVANLLISFNISNIFIYLISRDIKRIYTAKETLFKCILITIITSCMYVYLFFFYNFFLIYVTLIYGTLILIISAFVFIKRENIKIKK